MKTQCPCCCQVWRDDHKGAGLKVGLCDRCWDWHRKMGCIPSRSTAGIAIDPAICGGAPCMKGTLVMVSVVLDCLAAGMTEEEIRVQYPSLKKGAVVNALRYAASVIKVRRGI